MQENVNSSERTRVGFPNAPEPQKSGNGKIILLIAIILLILGGGAWYLLSRNEETIEFTNDTVTPFVAEETPTPEIVQVEKDELKVEVRNGTGTPGDAGKLETELTKLGYSGIETGNADNYNYEAAEVTFSADFPENYKEEIMDKLSDMYVSVETGTVNLGDFDVIIITGEAKGTSGSSTTPTKVPTATLTPSPRVTTTLTPTP